MKNKFLLSVSVLLILSSLMLYPQATDSLDVEDILNMSLADLMNTKVVTASKTSQSVKDVPATVYVITSEQIKERGYFTLEEALSDLPGLQFRNIIGFNSYVFMRGAPSQNNLILLMVDGIQINELNSGGFYGGGQFIMSEIEQIEIVLGPTSALYGTNAVSGIINIITKTPESKSVNVSILSGNFQTRMAAMRLSTYNSTKDIGLSVTGQYKTTEKADLGGEAGDNNWTEDMENYENDISFSAKFKARDFTSGITFQNKQSSNTTYFKSINDINLDKNTQWNINFLNAYLKYNYVKGEKWSNISTAYFRSATVLPNTIYQVIKASGTDDGSQTGYYRPNHLFGIESQLNYKIFDPVLFTCGIIGETESLAKGYSVSYSNSEELKPPKPAEPEMLHNSLFSYYAQANLKFLNYFSFTTGVRHDFSSYYGNVFIPRFGLIFNYSKFTAKATYNRAFRAPKPWDYTYGTGNNDLKPERMSSIEVFASVNINDKLNISGSVFNNNIKDKLTKDNTIPFDRWINKDILEITGFELNGTYTQKIIKYYVNYSFNDSRDQNEVFIPEISRHTANTGILISFMKSLSLNIRANYLGGRKNPFVIPSTGNDIIEDALLLNGNLCFTGLKNFTLNLKCNNILNTEYYHPNNRFAGRYRQPQRTIMLMASFDLEKNKSK